MLIDLQLTKVFGNAGKSLLSHCSVLKVQNIFRDPVPNDEPSEAGRHWRGAADERCVIFGVSRKWSLANPASDEHL